MLSPIAWIKLKGSLSQYYRARMIHDKKTSPSQRTLNKSSCPTCAETGFSPDKPAWFYLMEREGEQQLGITNHLEERMNTHSKNGTLGKISFDNEPNPTFFSPYAKIKEDGETKELMMFPYKIEDTYYFSYFHKDTIKNIDFQKFVLSGRGLRAWYKPHTVFDN